MDIKLNDDFEKLMWIAAFNAYASSTPVTRAWDLTITSHGKRADQAVLTYRERVAACGERKDQDKG